MTNLLAILHTTAAYQTAVLQLMVGEANFWAQKLELGETLPSETHRLQVHEVHPPPLGVSGGVGSSNYVYFFETGRLTSVRKLDWLKKASPPAGNLPDLASQPSRIDTNGALALATQTLASLGMNINRLGATDSRYVWQVQTQRRLPGGKVLSGASNLVSVPLFQVSWGNRPPPASSLYPLQMTILGTTPEIVELTVREKSIHPRPQLIVTNAAQLLGPTPPPVYFVERLLGGKSAHDTVAMPDRVEATLLRQYNEEGLDPRGPRFGPVRINPATARRLSELLADFNSYAWTSEKACEPDFEVKLRFVRGQEVVEASLCFLCDILEFKTANHTGAESFDFVHNELAKLVKATFPKDPQIAKLDLNTDHAQEAEGYFNRILRKEDQ